jgi:hypothetical protein
MNPYDGNARIFAKLSGARQEMGFSNRQRLFFLHNL